MGYPLKSYILVKIVGRFPKPLPPPLPIQCWVLLIQLCLQLLLQEPTVNRGKGGQLGIGIWGMSSIEQNTFLR